MSRNPVEREQATFCRICEATCGMRVRVRENRIVAIEPDREHVTSRGYACIKAHASPRCSTAPIACSIR